MLSSGGRSVSRGRCANICSEISIAEPVSEATWRGPFEKRNGSQLPQPAVMRLRSTASAGNF